MALTDKLSAIADGFRSSRGTTDKYTLDEMAVLAATPAGNDPVVESLNITANGTYNAPDGIDGYNPITVNVPQDGSPPEEAFNITGNCQYRFVGGWDWFIREYGNRITTSNISAAKNMFKQTAVKEIPFDINFGVYVTDISYMFYLAEKLETLPKLIGTVSYTNNLFDGCSMLRYIPEDFANSIDWSYISTNNVNSNTMFSGCSSLRSVPTNILHGSPNARYSGSYFYNGFNSCITLDELVDLPIPYTATWNSNAFANSFAYCSRLKNLTFALDPATNAPYVMNWKSQTIDLVYYIGYVSSVNTVINYNSGITADKEVVDDPTIYQALKDDPDWFTILAAYSRYNHDSAVATINSLPDTSAYLAEKGGTNTIKFRGVAGEKTDGGAINTLTEEEIAVATAKGWTVSFT